jgi:tripartite-type tricarboxylate transporter receptor subunit TctC
MAGGSLSYFWRVLLGLILVMLSQARLSAEDYPTRPVRLVLPFSAGGSIDIVARILAQAVSAEWHQQVIVENRAGTNGDRGATYVAHSEPDGYTLLATSQAVATNVSLHPLRLYDAEKDLAPVMLLASTNSVLFTAPSLHLNSVAEAINAAKAQPGKLNYGSQGVGTSASLAVELFKLQAGLDIMHVPFNQYGQQTSALINGEIAMVSVTVPQALALMATGILKPLAVSGRRRSAALPDVPTMQEAGVPNYEATTWYGLFAPAGTPREIIDKINAGFKAALESPDTRARLVGLGVEPVGSTSEYLHAYLIEEIDRWSKVIQASGMQVK